MNNTYWKTPDKSYFLIFDLFGVPNTEFSVFLVPVLNDKNISKLLKIVFKVIFCHLMPILKIQKIQKINLSTKKVNFNFFFEFIGKSRAEKKDICVIYPGHKCEI
jgi:hypothetical protein